MLGELLWIALTSIESPDYLSLAVKSYQGITSYSVTLRSESRVGSEALRYYYKRPGVIRMEFIKPHKGATLVYNPKDGKVRVRPFESIKFFVLTFDPDNRTVKSSRGHRVDQSDIGTLLKTIEELRSHGEVEHTGNEKVGEREAIVLNIKGEGDYTVEGDIHRYLLWLDQASYLPLKVEAYGLKGDLLERVWMEDLKVDVNFEEGL